MSLLTSQYTNVHAGYHHEFLQQPIMHDMAIYSCNITQYIVVPQSTYCFVLIISSIITDIRKINKITGLVVVVSGMQLLRLRSAIRRHHPPQRAVLSQICCFGERKMVLFQILLDVADGTSAWEKKCIQLSWVKVGLISYDNEAPVHATCTTLDVMYIIGMMEQTSDTANQLQNILVLVLIASS